MPQASKALGKKFEVWLELLLLGLGKERVLRNVEIHKDRFTYRQADLIYEQANKGRIETVIVEAKYVSGACLHYYLRKGPLKKIGAPTLINNVVDEVLERKSFVGADHAVLVTNKHFDSRTLSSTDSSSIIFIDREMLMNNYAKMLERSGIRNHISLEQSIAMIDLQRQNMCKNIIYIPRCPARHNTILYAYSNA